MWRLLDTDRWVHKVRHGCGVHSAPGVVQSRWHVFVHPADELRWGVKAGLRVSTWF